MRREDEKGDKRGNIIGVSVCDCECLSDELIRVMCQLSLHSHSAEGWIMRQLAGSTLTHSQVTQYIHTFISKNITEFLTY